MIKQFKLEKPTVPAHIASSKTCFLATNKAPLGSLLFRLDWGQSMRGRQHSPITTIYPLEMGRLQDNYYT